MNAVGEPGSRTFYAQARKGRELVTLLCEKEQIRELCNVLQQMLEELARKFPKGASYLQISAEMDLEEPIAPEFRVGQIGLGYDEEHDLIVIVARELAEEGDEDAAVARLFGTRAQMDALSRHGSEVVSRGRPVCPLCGRPMDVDGQGHGFCPRRNGHSDEIVFA
ncbi:MAG: DUF3090 family protein [Thermoflexales bacterium]|nr:DUF3090 family protein [Thermoflexales bacterium]